MNNRQKRLCRALLDFYDASGAQPYPLAQLARKTGYDASDLYDKDSQSGDLWPFDPRARGTLAGFLSFTPGKNPTVSITSAGLVALENLLKDEPLAPAPEKAVAPPPEKPSISPKPVLSPLKPEPAPVPVPAPTPPPAFSKPVPAPAPLAASSPSKSTPSFSPHFTSADIADAWSRFSYWLESDESVKTLLGRLEGRELIDAAFGKFFSEFLKSKDS